MINILTKLTGLQLAFVIIVPCVVLLVLFLVLYFPISKAILKKNFNYFYYKKVYKVAVDNDYYLINRFIFKVDNGSPEVIDHILFANKYIYLILSNYYEGDLVGKRGDSSLIFYPHKGKKCYTDNPVNASKKITSKISMMTGIDPTLFIGIILINDDCKVGVENDSKQFYIIQKNKFASLIKAIESRPIGTINQAQLEQAVKSIDKLNRRKK